MSLTPVPGSLASRWIPSCPGVLPKGSEGGAGKTPLQVVPRLRLQAGAQLLPSGD